MCVCKCGCVCPTGRSIIWFSIIEAGILTEAPLSHACRPSNQGDQIRFIWLTIKSSINLTISAPPHPHPHSSPWLRVDPRNCHQSAPPPPSAPVGMQLARAAKIAAIRTPTHTHSLTKTNQTHIIANYTLVSLVGLDKPDPLKINKDNTSWIKGFSASKNKNNSKKSSAHTHQKPSSVE